MSYKLLRRQKGIRDGIMLNNRRLKELMEIIISKIIREVFLNWLKDIWLNDFFISYQIQIQLLGINMPCDEKLKLRNIFINNK